MPVSPPPAIRGGRAAALLLTALLAATLCSCSGGHDTSPPTRPEIASMLQGHAAAARRHHRQEFLAAVAPGTFRRAQARSYANLARLPLASFRYRLGPAVQDRDAQRAVRRRYGATAVIVHVVLSYALRRADRRASAHDLWWTVVRQNGRIMVAGDSDLSTYGASTWRGPWDFGRLTVTHGRDDLVLGHPSQGSLPRQVATAVDQAVPAVSSVVGTSWPRYVAVVLPATSAELRADLASNAGTDTRIAAAAVNDGRDPLSGIVRGERLVLEPAQYTQLSAVGQRITLRHELTHVATARETSDTTPTWLVEGLAEYVGNLHSGQPVTVSASELAAQVRHHGPPKGLPSSSDFTGSGAPQAYEEAWLACRLIAARIGASGLLRLYRAVGTATATPDAAVSAALRHYLHLSRARFVARWRTYVAGRLT